MKSLKDIIYERLVLSKNKTKEPEFGTLLEFVCWSLNYEVFDTSYGVQAIPIKAERLNSSKYEDRIVDVLEDNNTYDTKEDILEFFESHKNDELENYSERGGDDGYDMQFSVSGVKFNKHSYTHYSFEMFCKFDLKDFRRRGYFEQ